MFRDITDVHFSWLTQLVNASPKMMFEGDGTPPVPSVGSGFVEGSEQHTQHFVKGTFKRNMSLKYTGRTHENHLTMHKCCICF